MSDELTAFINDELDRLGTQLASARLSAGDTRLWAIATLSEAAYCLRAVRAAGVMAATDVLVLLKEAAEVAFSDPAEEAQVVNSLMRSDTEGKPN